MKYVSVFNIYFLVIAIVGCKTSEKSDSPPQAIVPCVGLSAENCKLQASQCVFTATQNKCELKPYLVCEKLTVATCGTVVGCGVDKLTNLCAIAKNCADMDIDECGRNLRRCQYESATAKCVDPALAVNLACEQRSAATCAQDGKCIVSPQTKLCVGIFGDTSTSPGTQTYPSVCSQLPSDQATCQQKLNCCAWTGTTCAERFTYSISNVSSPGRACDSAPDINTCLRGQGFLNNCTWSRVFNKCVAANLCRVDINVCRCLPHCDMSEVGTCMVR